MKEEMVKINLTKKEIKTLLNAYDLYKTGKISATKEEIKPVEELIIKLKQQLNEQK